MATRILLVEDDPEICDVVERGLEADGCLVQVCPSGTKGVEEAIGKRYDLIILDVMLPGQDGFQVCGALRRAKVLTPILMLTARDAVRDRIQGLEAGADDYLPKPFDFGELRARIKALLRRDKVHRAPVLTIAHLKVNTLEKRVYVDGREVVLNGREYALLEALAVNEGRILTRDTILDRVWGNEDSFSNLVEVQIRRLRLKTEVGGLPRLIHTVHGLGYSLRRPEVES
ncbi:MAG TPA: response regulator transcription factor [Fimbriimonadaceae bacterium]|nr:response regulator transcription factor [Fimbriimonadaceae bacterium]